MYICELCKNNVDSVYFKNGKEVCEKCYRVSKPKVDKEHIGSLVSEENEKHTLPSIAVN